MMGWVTDKKFLVGVAIGFFVAPRVLKFVQAKRAQMAAPQG